MLQKNSDKRFVKYVVVFLYPQYCGYHTLLLIYYKDIIWVGTYYKGNTRFEYHYRYY